MNSPPDNLSYEQALAELEQIMRTLEDGQTGLDDALAQYERGVGLLKRCYQQLSAAEQRILMLCGQDEAGRPVLKPFAHASAMNSERGKAGTADGRG
jgi:exodeoxyribonuclease VII small subunit